MPPIGFLILVGLIRTNIEVTHTNIEAACMHHEANQTVPSGHQIDLDPMPIGRFPFRVQQYKRRNIYVFASTINNWLINSRTHSSSYVYIVLPYIKKIALLIDKRQKINFLQYHIE